MEAKYPLPTEAEVRVTAALCQKETSPRAADFRTLQDSRRSDLIV
jgi:hypothetical protein